MATDLKKEFTSIIEEGITGLITGAKDDVRKYAEAISTDAFNAAQIQDPDAREAVLNEILGQTRALGELNRIRAVNAGWEAASKVIAVGLRTLLAAVPAA